MKAIPIFATIITKNYLAYARALFESIIKVNPRSQLYVLLADRMDGYFDPQKESFKTIFLEDLKDQKVLRQMSFYYSPLEFCCALRPWLHEYLMQQENLERWIYLDSDILVFENLDHLFRLFDHSDLLFTPHLINIFNHDVAISMERGCLMSGMYNGGFLGIKKSEDVARFIHWWKKRLRYHGFNNISNWEYLDQIWLNFAPLYIKKTHLILDPGVDVAYWNLHERNLDIDTNNKLTAGGSPLLFYHFGGWDINQPNQITRYFPDENLIPYVKDGVWSYLSLTFKKALLENGHEETSHHPYAFGHFLKGEQITREMRMIYYERLRENRFPEKDPFESFELIKSILEVRHSEPSFFYKLRHRLKRALKTRLGLTGR